MINPHQLRALVLLAASATLTLTSLGWLITGAHYRDLAGWLEAASTALALVAAITAAVYAAGAFRLESDRATRAQAEKISIWAERSNHVVGRNGSGTPVFDLVVGVHLDPPPAAPLTYKVKIMPPADRPRNLDLDRQVLDQWDARGFKDEGWSLTFTDNAGIRWHRTHNGQLINLGKVLDTQPPQPGG